MLCYLVFFTNIYHFDFSWLLKGTCVNLPTAGRLWKLSDCVRRRLLRVTTTTRVTGVSWLSFQRGSIWCLYEPCPRFWSCSGGKPLEPSLDLLGGTAVWGTAHHQFDQVLCRTQRFRELNVVGVRRLLTMTTCWVAWLICISLCLSFWVWRTVCSQVHLTSHPSWTFITVERGKLLRLLNNVWTRYETVLRAVVNH